MASILVVDDYPNIRAFLSEVLKRDGHRVKEASNGEEALNIVKSSPSSFSLIIIDMVLPGIDGAKVIQMIHKKQLPVKIIATSGEYSGARFDVLDLAKSFGAMRTLKKPFDVHVFLSTVEEVLGT